MALSDSMLVAGGRYSVCARYTLDTNTWCKVSPPAQRHHYGSLVHVVSGDRVMLLGGVSDEELYGKIEYYLQASTSYIRIN